MGSQMINEPIGYTEQAGVYTPLYAAPPGSIVTQAFILCKECGGAISPCMGPQYNTVCLTCYAKAQDDSNMR